MSAEFDPYQVWLSIPPSEQPANFYRLLGLPLFESNPDVISNAADRQMAFVRTFQTGKYSELSQKILNELSLARITLLDAQKKAQYDATLHGEQKVEQTANQSGSFGEIQSPPPPSADTLTPLQPSDASQPFWGNFNDASGSSASGSSNILTASTKNAEFSFSVPDSAAQKSDSSSFSSINTESGIHFKDQVTKASSPKIKKNSNYKKVSSVKRKNNNMFMFAGIGSGVFLLLLMIVIIFLTGSGEKVSKRITGDDESLKRTYLEQANNFFINHEYEKAIDAYKKAYELDPDDNFASDQISIIYRFNLNDETQAEYWKNKKNANVSSVVGSNRGASSNDYEGKRNRKRGAHADTKEVKPSVRKNLIFENIINSAAQSAKVGDMEITIISIRQGTEPILTKDGLEANSPDKSTIITLSIKNINPRVSIKFTPWSVLLSSGKGTNITLRDKENVYDSALKSGELPKNSCKESRTLYSDDPPLEDILIFKRFVSGTKELFLTLPVEGTDGNYSDLTFSIKMQKDGRLFDAPKTESAPAKVDSGQAKPVTSESEQYAAGTRKTIVVNGVEFAFRWCPPGTFMMGSPESESGRNNDEKQHQVTLTNGFWMLETEVTQKQWKAVKGNNPSRFKGDNIPVEKVSWNDCQAFCKECAELGFPVQLPTEAQWEYACRAGTTGAHAGNFYEMAWHNSNSNNRTHPVGTKKPNAWGLYDMHGNVWEWCQDWYGDYPSVSVTDTIGSFNGSNRIYRGGCSGPTDNANHCRSAIRNHNTPSFRSSYVGFRCISYKLK